MDHLAGWASANGAKLAAVGWTEGRSWSRRWLQGNRAVGRSQRKTDLKDVSSFACGLLDSSQEQADPTLPDLQINLRVNDVVYESYIAFDQTTHTFDYPFALPAAVVPDDGVVLTLIDADEGTAGQEIGSVRISKEELARALDSKRLMSPSSAGVELLEVMASPEDGSFERRVVKVDTAKGGQTVSAFPADLQRRAMIKPLNKLSDH